MRLEPMAYSRSRAPPLKEGRTETQRQTALNLLRLTGLDDSAIAAVTGLAAESVAALRRASARSSCAYLLRAAAACSPWLNTRRASGHCCRRTEEFADSTARGYTRYEVHRSPERVGIHFLDFDLFDAPTHADKAIWRFEMRDAERPLVLLGHELQLNLIELRKADRLGTPTGSRCSSTGTRSKPCPRSPTSPCARRTRSTSP